MKIKWYGHSAFLIASDRGLKIITDPYDPGAYGDKLSYGKITDKSDIVLVTHDHSDHNYTKGLPGSPEVIKGSGLKTSKGITFKGIATFHDPSKGRERGQNTVFTFNLDGLQICHLGDLGHVLHQNERTEIGVMDVLFVPVGGFYTIDAKEAAQIAESMKPKVLIPMHFRTEKCGFPIAPVEDFLKGKPRVKQPGTSEVTFDKSSLPQQMEIAVLTHAL